MSVILGGISAQADLGRVMRALKPRGAPLALAVLLVGLAGLGDYVTGDDTAFTLIYLAPVALAAWRSGRSPSSTRRTSVCSNRIESSGRTAPTSWPSPRP